MNAAVELQLPTEAQTAGVMTAIGESTLRNLDHGDNAIIDLYRFNGRVLTGADGNSIHLISALDPVMPDGTRTAN